MAITFRMSNRIDAPLEAVLEKFIDPEEQEVVARHFGSDVARCERTDGAAGPHIELYTEEPDRKMGGTNRSTLYLDWDLAARRCTWRREDHGYGKRFRMSGEMVLEPAGEGACTMNERGEIEIDYPILGKKIAKKIAAALERKHPEKCRYWTERVQG